MERKQRVKRQPVTAILNGKTRIFPRKTMKAANHHIFAARKRIRNKHNAQIALRMMTRYRRVAKLPPSVKAKDSWETGL